MMGPPAGRRSAGRCSGAHRSGALLAGIVVVLAILGGCADQRADGAHGPVEIEVHLDEYERWEASGPSVDAALLCPTGRRHRLAVHDPDTGEELSWWVWPRLLAQVSGPTERPDAVEVVEYACTDGSGSFTATENQHRGEWDLVGGTGAYADSTGSGTISFVADERAEPWRLHIAARLD